MYIILNPSILEQKSDYIVSCYMECNDYGSYV